MSSIYTHTGHILDWYVAVTVLYLYLSCSIHFSFNFRIVFVSQVLTGLGTQLCSLWGKEESIGRPPNFSTYLEAITTFSRHPSLSVAHYANALWMAFFKHDHISKDPVLVSFIPKWVAASAPKIMKVCFIKIYLILV